MSCQRLILSFEDCSRKHPVEARYLCKHLEAAVAWCLIASVCPDEGALQTGSCFSQLCASINLQLATVQGSPAADR